MNRWRWPRSPVAPGGVLADTAVFPWRTGAEAQGSEADEPVPTTPVVVRPWSVEIGLLVARVVVGVGGVLGGARTLFSLPPGAAGGAAGVRAVLTGYGFTPVEPLATAFGWAQLGAGVLVLLGVLASFAASVFVAIGVVAVVVTAPAAWVAGTLGPVAPSLYGLALAGVVVLAGPGRISGDADRPWHRHQSAVGLACLVIGLMAAVTVLLFFRGPV